MKKLIIFFIDIFAIFTIICCAPKKDVAYWINPNRLSTTAIQSYEYDCNRYEFDSICNLNNIPSDLSVWLVTPFMNAVTKEGKNRYLYTVENNIDSMMNDVYVTDLEIGTDTIFHLEIRKLILIK